MASSPSSIDLVAAARTSAKRKPTHGTVTKTKNGVSYTALIPPPKYRAAGRNSDSFARPKFTLAELGQASQGMSPTIFQAACYSYAGDNSDYWNLHAALLHRAQHIAAQERWSPTVPDRHGLTQPYLPHLAITLLDADRHAHRFNLYPGVYAEWMRVTDKTWENDLAPKFWRLHQVWDGWLETARRMIQARLRSE